MKIDTKRETGNLNVGVLLLALGALALLGQAGFFRAMGGLIGAALFGAAGLFLVRRYYRATDARGEIWALCVGFGLLGLGAAAITGPLSGTAFLGLTGVGFLLAYRHDRSNWWAVIPAGVLLTLALVAGLDRLAPPFASGPVFFLGLAAVFWYLYREPRQPRPWALYPTLVFATLALLSFSDSAGWVMPVVLIAVGLYLLNRRQDGGFDLKEAGDELSSRLEPLLDATERAVRSVVAKVESREEPSGPSADGESTGEEESRRPDPEITASSADAGTTAAEANPDAPGPERTGEGPAGSAAGPAPAEDETKPSV